MEVEIIDYDHFGRGIAKINNKIIFIPNTMIGEIVKIEIVKNKKKFAEGRVINFIKINKHRQDNLCPYYLSCGGCDILHMNYQDQLIFKQNKINNIFKKYLNIDNQIISHIIPSDQQFNYRNKVTFHFKKGMRGFFAKESNYIIPIDHCLLLDHSLNEEIKRLDYDHNLVMRTNGEDILKTKQGKIKIKIGDISYLVSINSFFQVNINVTKKLYDKIKELADLTGNESVIDLYCGTGTIGLYLSQKAKKVLGIEINKQAVIDANENKKINNITNIDFICSDVANAINQIDGDVDIIIVDPPRSGLDNITINQILQLKPQKIIYVSCDPMTLVRDLKKWEIDYNISNIIPFDMFPNTHHVECVCLLNLR